MVADAHVKVDTGMGRLGIRFDELSEFVPALERFRNVRIDGLMSHLAAADDTSCQPLTHDQIQRFEEAAGVFRRARLPPNAICILQTRPASTGIAKRGETWCDRAACCTACGATFFRSLN